MTGTGAFAWVGLVTSEALMAVVLTPLALATLAFTRAGHRLAWLGMVAAMPAMLLGGILTMANDSTMALTVNVDWLLLGARFGVDAQSADFLLLSGVLWFAASIAAHGYFDTDAQRRLAPWWLLAMAGNVALPITLDPLTYFAFFALMSFASYGLVVFRLDTAALRAGRTYMVYVIAGEVVLFCALVTTGVHLAAALALLLIGYGIKVGVFGLHAWLPQAHGVAPAPASAVLSATMLKAGLLGWLLKLLFDADPLYALLLGGVSLVLAAISLRWVVDPAESARGH